MMMKQTIKKCTRPYYDTAYTDGNVNNDDIYIKLNFLSLKQYDESECNTN